jgi:Ni,Fe-hydrogenase III small subunit
MAFSVIKIFRRHGKQFVKDLRRAQVPDPFRGRPVISSSITPDEEEAAIAVCPSGAIEPGPFRLDLGKCEFCKECSFITSGKISFTNDHHLATNIRDNLVIQKGEDKPIVVDPTKIRKEITSLFRHALKLRQVSAGGDNSAEMELNATGNVNFDMGRYGIEFVSSPRHADGIVVTGPVNASMSEALRLTWEAVPAPKVIILAGTAAISGGIMTGSISMNREFLEKNPPDLFVPGNPPHPLTFINGVLDLTRRR